MRKLDSVQLEELRDRRASGASPSALAREFGLSERHVRRLVEDVPPPPPELELGADRSVAAAVERLLERLDVDAVTDVRVSMARLLAERLDEAGTRDTP